MPCKSPVQRLLLYGQRYSRRELEPCTIQETINRTRWTEIPFKTVYIIMVEWRKSSQGANITFANHVCESVCESIKGRKRASCYEDEWIVWEDAAADARLINRDSSSASPACTHPMRRIAAANSCMVSSPLAFSSAMLHMSRRMGYDKLLLLKTSIAASDLSAPPCWQPGRRRIWFAKFVSSSVGEKSFNVIGRDKRMCCYPSSC